MASGHLPPFHAHLPHRLGRPWAAPIQISPSPLLSLIRLIWHWSFRWPHGVGAHTWPLAPLPRPSPLPPCPPSPPLPLAPLPLRQPARHLWVGGCQALQRPAPHTWIERLGVWHLVSRPRQPHPPTHPAPTRPHPTPLSLPPPPPTPPNAQHPPRPGVPRRPPRPAPPRAPTGTNRPDNTTLCVRSLLVCPSATGTRLLRAEQKGR